MAIRMTRAEYEAKYGKPPVLPSTTPIKMTHDEYVAKYVSPKPGFISGVTEAAKARDINVGKIASQVAQGKQTTAEGIFQTAGQAAGLVGDVGFQAIKAITPEPIQQKVGEVAGKIAQEPVVQDIAGAYMNWAKQNPRAATNLESTVNIASLLPIGKATKVGTEVAGEAIATTGKALETSGAKGIMASKQKFVRELVSPIRTNAVKEAQVGRTTETGFGPFKKSVVTPTSQELQQEKYLLNIPDLSPKNTAQRNFNVIKKYNTQEAINLENTIKNNDFIIPKKEIISRLNQAKSELKLSPVLVGDSQKTADRLLIGANKFINENFGTGSGLLKARKEYDQWVLSQKPKTFDATADNAFTIANREVRKTFNNLLEEKAPNLGIKKSLQKQSALYNALETITPKAAQEADTAIGRALQRTGQVLGTKNKIVQGIAAAVGIGGLGAAATFAPAAAVIGGTSYVLYRGGKFILNPKIRSSLGKLLQTSGHLMNPSDKKILEKALSGTIVKSAVENK